MNRIMAGSKRWALASGFAAAVFTLSGLAEPTVQVSFSYPEKATFRLGSGKSFSGRLLGGRGNVICPKVLGKTALDLAVGTYPLEVVEKDKPALRGWFHVAYTSEKTGLTVFDAGIDQDLYTKAREGSPIAYGIRLQEEKSKEDLEGDPGKPVVWYLLGNRQRLDPLDDPKKAKTVELLLKSPPNAEYLLGARMGKSSCWTNDGDVTWVEFRKDAIYPFELHLYNGSERKQARKIARFAGSVKLKSWTYYTALCQLEVLAGLSQTDLMELQPGQVKTYAIAGKAIEGNVFPEKESESEEKVLVEVSVGRKDF